MTFNKLKIIFLFFFSIILADDCTDSFACNYNPNAQIDDGSCYYPYECPDNSFECYVNNCNPPTGFESNQSNKLLFLFIDSSYKHNSQFPLFEYEDWIGGFNEYDETQNGSCINISDNCPDVNSDGFLTENAEVCVGSKYWIGPNSDLPLYGYEALNSLTEGY